MKKQTCIHVLLLTILFAVCLLSGCGRDSHDGNNKNPEDSIIGNYKAVFDMKDYLNEETDESLSSSVYIEFYLDLKDNNNYHIYNDEDQVKESFSKIYKEIWGDIMSEDAIDSLLEGIGTTEMTVSEKGTYQLKGDKIILTREDSSAGESEFGEEGTIGEDGSITFPLNVKNSSASYNLIFKKK